MSSLSLKTVGSECANETVSPLVPHLKLLGSSDLTPEHVAVLQQKVGISCPDIVVKLYEAWSEAQYDMFSPDDGVRIFIENYRGAYDSPADFIHDERYSEQAFPDVKTQCEQDATRAELDGCYQFIDAPDQHGDMVYVFDGPAVYAER
ncbi:hypothetical protein QGP82_25445 [Leptothoe sp. LEGE 181152]|nr:hypothetical protein [Leptothoe sp. LEGE 181152]